MGYDKEVLDKYNKDNGVLYEFFFFFVFKLVDVEGNELFVFEGIWVFVGDFLVKIMVKVG